MTGRELAVVQGWADTRTTLRAWNAAPLPVLRSWLLASLAVALGLLASVWLVAVITPVDTTPMLLPGVHWPAGPDDVTEIFLRNLLVLALHAMACLAGFIAKTSLPLEAQAYKGWWRVVHDRAGPAAIAFVGAATLFSLATQAWILGGFLGTLAWQFDTSPAAVLAVKAVHAIPELVALFLPLAAWLVAARAGAWHQLLAATIATTLLALPVIFLAAVVEVALTPELLRSLHFV
jgi:hypothetical protein